MRRTQNYGLPIIESKDRYSKEEQNNAMDIIDEELHGLSQSFKNVINDVNTSIESVKEFENQIQEDYDSLKRIIIDENASAKLQNQINTINTDLENANMEVKLARGTHNTLNDRLCEADKKQNSLSSQLEEIKSQQEQYYIPKEKIKIPTGFTFSKPLNIKKVGIGYYETNIEPENFYPSTNGKTYYVDLVNGYSGNDGLTMDTAFKSLQTAYEKADVETIILKGGWYNKDQHPTPTKNVKLKAYNGEEVIFGADAVVTWEIHSGTTYKCSRTLTVGVWDISNKNEYGEFIPIIKRNSVNEVMSNPNSWFFDTATNIVYFNSFDGRIPDDKIKVTLGVQPFVVTGGCTVYMEGIKCYFGASTNLQCTATLQPSFLAKNCEFSYSDTANGFSCNGGKLVILKNCESSHNKSDGFNYHAGYGLNGEFIEINCIGRNNGRDGVGTNNGSTAHELYVGVRVGGQYDSNEGPNVADVNGAKTLNVGCSAYNSVAINTLKRDFVCDGDIGGKMWLDNCYTKDSDYSVSCPRGNMYVRNSIITKEVAGNVVNYN